MSSATSLHDRIGSMIDQIGQPDYSLRELVLGLREVRDELLALSESANVDLIEKCALICDAYAADTEQMKNESRGYWTEEAKAVFDAQKELARAIRALKETSAVGPRRSNGAADAGTSVSGPERFDKQRESPFDKTAADRMAAAVDVMIRRNVLDPRSLVADARLDYGQPFANAEAIIFDGEKPERATNDQSSAAEVLRDFIADLNADNLSIAEASYSDAGPSYDPVDPVREEKINDALHAAVDALARSATAKGS